MEESDDVMLVLRNGSHVPGRMLPDSLVTPYLVILNIALNEQLGRRSLLIMPDSMGTDSFRRLCVVLRWGDKSGRAPAV